MFTPYVALILGLDFLTTRKVQGKGYGAETKCMESYDKGMQTENEYG
jgi:hypothetical protein